MSVTKGIYKDILSIKISYVLYGELSNYEDVITINIDLKNNKVLSNDDMIDIVENAKEEKLRNIQKNINFYKNHPSIEHFLPMFIAFGNAINKKGKSFNSEMLYSNISMESFIFDKKEA